MLLAIQILFLLAQLALLVWVLGFLYRAVSDLMSIPLDVPFVPTPTRYAKQIAEALALNADDTLYELGSGDGRMLLAFARMCPEARFVGIERNILLYLQSVARKRLHRSARNVEFRHANIFASDFSEATKVYTYLLTSVMDRLYPELEKNAHVVVASRAFRFTGKSPLQEIRIAKRDGSHNEHMLYVYELQRGSRE